jgi:microcystin-dependent protein
MEPFVGQIALFPYDFVPKGWSACEGQLIPVNQNQMLFALVGTTFGGDGRTSFSLPNLKGKEPEANLRYCIAIEGIFPQRS